VVDSISLQANHRMAKVLKAKGYDLKAFKPVWIRAGGTVTDPSGPGPFFVEAEGTYSGGGRPALDLDVDPVELALETLDWLCRVTRQGKITVASCAGVPWQAASQIHFAHASTSIVKP